MSDNRTDLPSPGSSNFSQRVRETLMVYLGRQGNPLDRGLTLRDLLDAGLLKLRDGVTLRPGVQPPIEPGPVIDAPVDLTPPPTPTGFAVSAAITHVFIEHDPPTFPMGGGYLRTRVYGATRLPTDPLPTFDDAVEIAQFTGQVYAHSTNPSTTWHLWIKWETKAEVLSPTPAGGTNGVVVRTGEDVALLLEALQGQITESQLYQDLGARIDLIDGPASLSGSVAQRVAAEAAARVQAIAQETQARSDALAAEAQARLLLAGRVGDNVAAIQAESTARTTADNALAQQITTLQSTVTTNNTTLTAAIRQEATTRASETGNLFAKYTVKIDANGYVSGFGLASTANNATPTSEFIVRADSFAIASPSGPGITPAEPFFVRTTPTTINGVSVPAGVYIQDGFIQNGTITNAKIANLAVDNAKVANLSASKLTAGSIAVGQHIQSSNYVAGSQGWRINGDGTAEFSGVVARGTIYASAGRIGGSVIGSTFIQSDTYQANVSGWRFNSDGTGQIGGFIVGTDHIRSSNYSAGSAGWRLDRNGNFEANTGTFRGALAAATGSFAGSLQAATGTFRGALQAATGTFRGELQAATGTFSGSLTAQAVNAIDTINIAGEAVTVPVGAEWQGSWNQGGQRVATPARDFQGQRVVVIASASFEGYGDETTWNADMYLYRDGLVIRSIPFRTAPNAAATHVAFVIVDTPPLGSHSYGVGFGPTYSPLGGVAISAAAVVALGVKR